MKTVYLDNAATSFPKPDGVSNRMKEYMDSGCKSTPIEEFWRELDEEV